MRTTRLIAGTMTAALLGVTPMALATSAEAAVTVTTATTLTSEKAAYMYGDTIFFDAAVTTTDPANPYAPGAATLYIQRPGSTTWEPLASDDGASYLYFVDIVAESNALYKVVYPGGVDGTGDVYTPSESAPFAIATSRNLTIKNPRGTFVKGKIKPDYAKKKVVVQKKVGKKWKKFRALKTSKKSTFQVTLPASRKRTYWRFVVKANAEFAATVAEGSTIRYRSAGRVAIR
ncbi:hypothetical protein HN031_02990 [Nocardioides sp. zg-1308]|uniref:Surface-anchored protein n=1 Tax=Nocardioides renjunii TaxID=3095075 RepID=A0ABU5K6D3_9ACTN|nr:MULTISPECIES: hypothetical protein [unclassified Nocardioides]MDZ5660531.1 hypothetical protein [Nocardioides sp. S-58]NPD03647.1 hypothetical protein [Nocardioides sp. zg-1308]WQQ21529.1 hypothetical protein SHK17_16740 [Nocardioides sp. S-34]